MDAELKAKWLEALRSGKYDQGTGQLRDSRHCFCCLGVLCDVAAPEAWDDDMWAYGKDEDRKEEVGNLPFRFRLKTGITDTNERDLIRLNDQDKKSFAEIANWIEGNL